MGNPLVVGVDVHRKRNTVCVMDTMGREIDHQLSVANTPAGTKTLAEHLHALASSEQCDSLRIACEATGWYWWHFFRALDRDPLLRHQPLDLFSLNPRLVAKLKAAYSNDDKTDLTDAFVVADRLRMNRDLPHPFEDDLPHMRVRLLTRHRCHLVRGLVRLKAYCLAHLYLKASEYTSIKPFSDVFGVTSRALIRDFTLEEIANLSLEDLAEVVDRLSKHTLADPTTTARKVQAVATDSYTLPDQLLESVDLILGQTLREIDYTEQLIRRTDTAIAQAMKSLPNTLETIPGIGPVFAGGIVSEIGDLSRFGNDQAKVAKYAGLKWRRTQSADFEAEDTPLTNDGNRYLRYYLCEGANCVRTRVAEYKAFYERKCREVRKHQHKRALVLTARKLVRLVVRLLADNQPFQPRMHSD
jgi:transposase